MNADWKGIERENEARWLVATRIVGFCMLGVGLVGSAIALLIGRPDAAIDGIAPTVLGLAIVVVDAASRLRRRSSD